MTIANPFGRSDELIEDSNSNPFGRNDTPVDESPENPFGRNDIPIDDVPDNSTVDREPTIFDNPDAKATTLPTDANAPRFDPKNFFASNIETINQLNGDEMPEPQFLFQVKGDPSSFTQLDPVQQVVTRNQLHEAMRHEMIRKSLKENNGFLVIAPGFEGHEEGSPDTFGAAAGLTLEYLGNVAKGGIQDIAEAVGGESKNPLRNLGAAFQGHPTTPFDEATADVEGWAKAAKNVSDSVAHMLPALAVSGRVGGELKAAGTPAMLADSVAGGAVFGLTPQGYDLQQGATMAAFPAISAFGGKIALESLGKMGIYFQNEGAVKAAQTFGGLVSSQAYMETLALPEYLEMTPAQRTEAFQHSLGVNLALHLGHVKGIIDAGRSQKQIEKAVNDQINTSANTVALLHSGEGFIADADMLTRIIQMPDVTPDHVRIVSRGLEQNGAPLTANVFRQNAITAMRMREQQAQKQPVTEQQQPTIEPEAAPVTPEPAVVPEVQQAADAWQAAEKRFRQAQRQEPENLEDMRQAREDAEIEFHALAEEHNITQEQFDKLRDYATRTTTETRPDLETLAEEAVATNPASEARTGRVEDYQGEPMEMVAMAEELSKSAPSNLSSILVTKGSLGRGGFFAADLTGAKTLGDVNVHGLQAVELSNGKKVYVNPNHLRTDQFETLKATAPTEKPTEPLTPVERAVADIPQDMRVRRSAQELQSAAITKVNQEILDSGRWPNGRKLKASERKQLEQEIEDLKPSQPVAETVAGETAQQPAQDIPPAERLVIDNMGLAKSVAAQYANLDPAQAESVAVGALAKAAEKYRPETGVKFSTYATQAMNNSLRNELEKNATKKRGGDVEKISMDEQKEDGVDVAESIASEAKDPLQEMAANETATLVQDVMNKLDPKEREAINSFLQSGRTAIDAKLAAKLRGLFEESGLTVEDLIGMGGARPSEFGKPTSIEALTQVLQSHQSPKLPLSERMDIAGRFVDFITGIREGAEGSIAKLGAYASTLKDTLTRLPEWTDFKSNLGKMTAANQKNDFEVRKFVNEIRKRVPNALTREAMTNWIQAGGDEAVLRHRASLSKPPYKAGYEAALKLSPDEKILAGNISTFLDARLQEGLEAGILESGVENYVTQIWRKPNPVSQKLVSDFQIGKLSTNLRFARQRIFDSYFHGESQGFRPISKDVGALIAAYDQSFNRVLSGRSFVKQLTKGRASDDRPLVAPSGAASVVKDAAGTKQALLIHPEATPADARDYKPIDHPSLRKWRWAGTDVDGKPVMFEGQLLVHPEIYTHLNNVLKQSWFRQNSIARNVLSFQSFIKQTKLSLSLFHPAQVAVHALGHRVNPLPNKINPFPRKLEPVDFSDPLTYELASHGLQLADYRAMEAFSEGISGHGGLIDKLPLVGEWHQKLNQWIFQDYIPQLKVAMGKAAFKRNMHLLRDERARGVINRDQILELTAKQSNAAFGELNYAMLGKNGRNQTVQDFLRLTLLAPDFLEARLRFLGQAMSPKLGKEQRDALAVMAVYLFVAARIANAAFNDGDTKPELMFGVKVGDREFTMRNLLGDAAHLTTDMRTFLAGRLSFYSHAALEYLTGRDNQGVKRSTVEQFADAVKWLVPISLDKKEGTTVLQHVPGVIGVTSKKSSVISEAFKMAAEFNRNSPDPGDRAFQKRKDAETNLKSDYLPFSEALRKDDAETAEDEYQALLEMGKKPEQIDAYFSKEPTFTGSLDREQRLLDSLKSDTNKLKVYHEAKAEREAVANKYWKFIGTRAKGAK